MSGDVAKRRRLAAALLGPEAVPEPQQPLHRVVRGEVIEAGARTLRLATPNGEETLLLADTASLWRGGPAAPTELRPGDDVVLRCAAGGRWVAERVWARIARVTGVIRGRSGDGVEVDVGHDRPSATVVIGYRVSGRMAVRHPVLEPGYLFDAVGVWRDGVVHAVRPATTQPPVPVGELRPRRRRESGPRVSGMVSWYDPADGDPAAAGAQLAGAAYPALDPASDCGCPPVRGCLPLPLMSLGMTFWLRNDDTGDNAVVPIVACGAPAAHFCDRCAAGASAESGRLARLTLLSFVALGGDPEVGCCNATMTTG
ncbi:hypothetical protein [Halostreptopolyspora alba]|uniref:Uncharacterized protein n=1 Tax=Halostreptopolyspora alba TaxID=2487137 RepID=A0A3N0ED98_9ACTN|nr:hypothetical protein EFW17_07715 [Nocardiopsaceae bacterium YIM 96095]